MHILSDYIISGLLLIAAVSIGYLPVFFLLRKRAYFQRQLSILLFGAFVLVVLFATVLVSLRYGFDLGPRWRSVNLVPFSWMFKPWSMGSERMIAQQIANILMFVPIGFFMPVVFARLRAFYKTTLLVLAFTVSIETLQYFIGRSADIDDVLLNLLGGMLGYALFALFSRVFKEKNWWRKALGEIRK